MVSKPKLSLHQKKNQDEETDQSQSELDTNTTNTNNNLSSELANLNNLLKDGVLTQEEFDKAKKKILDN